MPQTHVEVILFTLQYLKTTCNTFYLAMDVTQKWFQCHLRCRMDLRAMLLHQNPGSRSSSKTRNISILIYWSLHRYETSTRQMTPSLLKKSSLTPSSSGAGTSSLAAERTSHHDAWRTMMILQAINELWLSHVTSKENSNLQAGSPPRTQINVLQVWKSAGWLCKSVLFQLKIFSGSRLSS